MRTIAFIGAGGINSWALQELMDTIKIFDKNNDFYIKIFDQDFVEEKNILRQNQNFTPEDLMENKAKVLGKRFGFDYEKVYITKDNISKLEKFEDIIIGVDNNKTRQLIYEYAILNKKYLLDMRAQGTQIAFNVIEHSAKHPPKPIEYWNEKYFGNKTIMERKGSCQLDTDIQNDNIQNGNKIIAKIGVLGIYLKHIRGEELATTEWKWMY